MPGYLDWFPFYVFLWRDSERIRAMSAGARGVWLELATKQWIDGDLPPGVPALVSIARASIPEVREALWAFPYVPRSRKRRRNPQLHKVKTEQQDKYEKMRKGGSKGGKSKSKGASSLPLGGVALDQSDLPIKKINQGGNLDANGAVSAKASGPYASIATEDCSCGGWGGMWVGGKLRICGCPAGVHRKSVLKRDGKAPFPPRASA